jgi:WD repeat-containing protein 68
MGQHASASAHHQQQQQQQQQQHMYNSPDAYSAGGSAPNINLHQATPQTTQYSSAPASNPPNNVPGSLQPGSSNSQQHQQQQQRPGPSSAYTAPSTVPTMPQLSTNAQQYTLPTRSNTNTMNQQSSHSYSRSSPAGLGPDQKYIPFSHTPENPKYAAGTPAQKYFPSTPSGAASHSPLGLADIRPRANSSMTEEATGAGAFFNDSDKVPSNSNYLAPWGVYAYDWCKWNVHSGNSAGKMAIGSYLEDTHNFVRPTNSSISMHVNIARLDPNPRYPDNPARDVHFGLYPIWPRIHSCCRSHMLISCHPNTLGAALIAETVH